MSKTPYRFANFLSFNVNPTYAAIAEEVGRQLNIETSFEEGQTFSQFRDDELAVGFVCGLPYRKMGFAEAPPFNLLVSPVLHEERAKGKPVYFSDIVVHVDSPSKTFQDLKGASFGFNERTSYSGYRAMQWYLKELGLDWSFLGEQIESGAHLNSIAMVANGEVDCAAIDGHSLLMERLVKPELCNQLRVIDEIGPSPIPPVVCGSYLPQSMQDDMREVFLHLHEKEEMQMALMAGGIERFVATEPEWYEPLAERVDLSVVDFYEGCG